MEMTQLELSNKDIQMTKGIAIISMLFLHLFCLADKQVTGTPIVVLPNGVPLLYYIGWLSAICAPLFCLCNGYAHYRQGLIGGLSSKKRFKRYLKFMSHLVLAVLLVALFGLLYGGGEDTRFYVEVYFKFVSYRLLIYRCMVVCMVLCMLCVPLKKIF